MKSRISWCALVLAVAGFCPPAAAQDNCLRSFFTGVAKDTARRNCWPTPFIYPARQAAREPFANMVANGWEVQNMLTDGHFDVETGSLTPAGQAMVLRILNDTPQQHRGIFVHRAERPRRPRRTSTPSSSSSSSRFPPASIPQCWNRGGLRTVIPRRVTTSCGRNSSRRCPIPSWRPRIRAAPRPAAPRISSGCRNLGATTWRNHHRRPPSFRHAPPPPAPACGRGRRAQGLAG